MDDARARAILGVDPGAGADAVEAAFRARAWAAHPDTGGSGAHFAELSEARRVLSRPDRLSARPAARPAPRPEPPQWVTAAATTAASVASDLEVLGAVLGRRVRRWLVRHLEP
jgi:hypothetical protein